MARRSISEFGRDQAGAVAATYAIAIPMLIGVAGVGLDYGRMVALDTELQNAADQAALAGATQLDGTAGSMERAMAAAQGGLVTNFTRVANDGDTPAVDVPGASIVFYQTRPDAESKANGFTDVTRYEDAHFVQLSVETRAARYALTPLIGAFGATLAAQATSGLGSAICKVPPVMICNPEEPIGNADTELLFDADSRVGVGILMVSNDSYTPGSFGYLQTGANGTNALAAAIGWDNRPGDCVSLDGVELKDGVNASVIDAFNTRFDVPGSGNSCVSYGGINGTCSPSVNVRKDMVRGNACTANAWQQNAANAATSLTHNYRPTSRALYPAGTTPDIMGHPRDLCHAWSKTGDCNAVNGGKGARVGTGDWDINAYWRSNYGANYANQVSTTYGPQPKGYPTRYAVYRWEAENIAAGTLTPNSGRLLACWMHAPYLVPLHCLHCSIVGRSRSRGVMQRRQAQRVGVSLKHISSQA